MKFAVIGAAAVAVAAFVTPALAQGAVEHSGYCGQFYSNANYQIWDQAIHAPMAVTIVAGRAGTL